MSSKKAPTRESIGQAVRKYRQAKGLTQAQLGKLAFDYPENEKNAAQQKVKFIESGSQKWPRIDDIFLLAQALRVKVDDLLKNE